MSFARKVGRVAQRALQPLETQLRRRAAAPDRAPLFIVGPPRSGSTLLYQLLVRRYRLCYFSNLTMRMPAATLSLAKLASTCGGFDPPADFRSRYGRTQGWNAPHQGLPFWTEWLPQFPHELGPDDVPERVKARLRDTVLALQRIGDAPFINKWPPNSLRLRLLTELYPNAVFVRITRDVDALVRSILRCRDEICRQGSGWFSVKPMGYDEILRAYEPAAQARWQVENIEKIIDRDAAAAGPRIVTVRYDELASRPREVLDGLAAFYRRTTGDALRERSEVPASFTAPASAEASGPAPRAG